MRRRPVRDRLTLVFLAFPWRAAISQLLLYSVPLSPQRFHAQRIGVSLCLTQTTPVTWPDPLRPLAYTEPSVVITRVWAAVALLVTMAALAPRDLHANVWRRCRS